MCVYIMCDKTKNVQIYKISGLYFTSILLTGILSKQRCHPHVLLARDVVYFLQGLRIALVLLDFLLLNSTALKVMRLFRIYIMF